MTAPPWSDLPAPALHTILIKTSDEKSVTAAFTALAFSGVCSSWRSISKAAHIDLLASRPPTLINISNASITFFNLYDKPIHSRRCPPLLRPMRFTGQSCGYLIMHSSLREPVVFHPLTGEKFEFPVFSRSISRAFLSAPPTSPDCVLWLTSSDAVHWCPIGGFDWCSIPYMGVRTAVVFKDKLYLSNFSTAHFQVDVLCKDGVLQRIRLPPVFQMWRGELYSMDLIELGEELCMVVDRYSQPPMVYKLCEEKTNWVKMESLGCYAVFLIAGGCTGVACDTRGSEGVIMENCIYVVHFDRKYYTINSLDGSVRQNSYFE